MAEEKKRATRVLVALVAAVGVLGMANSFASRIRAKAFGDNNNYVVTIYNAVIQCVVYVLAYAVLVMCMPPGVEPGPFAPRTPPTSVHVPIA